jgi:calcineurin-like phosphoesterase family protein
MRTALISDIHGDFARLLNVLADIESQGCDRILCLGDIVNGGDRNAEAVQHLRDLKIAIVRGNHDENPSVNLSRELQAFLKEQPEEIVEGDVIYTHVSPRAKKRKVQTDFEVWNVFDDTLYRRIFIGDVHVPMIWGQQCEVAVSATRYGIVYDEPFVMDTEDRYLICVGAVGYSRDSDARPRYAIYDDGADSIMFRMLNDEKTKARN